MANLGWCLMYDYSIFWSNCFNKSTNFNLWVSSMSHSISIVYLFHSCNQTSWALLLSQISPAQIFFLSASRFEATCNRLIIWLWIDFLAVVPAFSDHLYDRWVSARFKLFFLPLGSKSRNFVVIIGCLECLRINMPRSLSTFKTVLYGLWLPLFLSFIFSLQMLLIT